VLCDFLEERWPSMDLVADELLANVSAHAGWQAERVRPGFARRASLVSASAAAWKLDRGWNRFWRYPRAVRKLAGFDAWHVCDHSYAHVALELRRERTGVFCHDLDAFRCLLGQETRPRWFRALARRTLRGLQRAAVVFHTTRAVREEIVRHGLVDETKLVLAPPGVAEEFIAEGERAAGRYLLHVGSSAPRKRLDVLVAVFEKLRARYPGLELVQVGGDTKGSITRDELAKLYRGAALVLLPSEREGFCLPLVEALACGAPVLASDLPVLREVAGDAASYVPVGDVARWAERAGELLERPETGPARDLRLARAKGFTWSVHASAVVGAYERLLT
jgi:glycosyltransferase involved in cell wall biosynthesis